MATLNSPNVGNYRIGKGVAEFKREGAIAFTHLGNCPAIALTPNVETLDHFSSMAGVRQKDLTIILEKAATLAITMEEITAHNLSLAIAGTVDENTPGGPTVEIFAGNAVNGEFKFTSTNEIGPKFDVHLYNVSFIPSGEIPFISDEWNAMEVEAQVLAASGGPNDGKFGIIQITNIDEPS